MSQKRKSFKTQNSVIVQKIQHRPSLNSKIRSIPFITRKRRYAFGHEITISSKLPCYKGFQKLNYQSYKPIDAFKIPNSTKNSLIFEYLIFTKKYSHIPSVFKQDAEPPNCFRPTEELNFDSGLKSFDIEKSYPVKKIIRFLKELTQKTTLKGLEHNDKVVRLRKCSQYRKIILAYLFIMSITCLTFGLIYPSMRSKLLQISLALLSLTIISSIFAYFSGIKTTQKIEDIAYKELLLAIRDENSRLRVRETQFYNPKKFSDKNRYFSCHWDLGIKGYWVELRMKEITNKVRSTISVRLRLSTRKSVTFGERSQQGAPTESNRSPRRQVEYGIHLSPPPSSMKHLKEIHRQGTDYLECTSEQLTQGIRAIDTINMVYSKPKYPSRLSHASTSSEKMISSGNSARSLASSSEIDIVIVEVDEDDEVSDSERYGQEDFSLGSKMSRFWAESTVTKLTVFQSEKVVQKRRKRLKELGYGNEDSERSKFETRPDY